MGPHSLRGLQGSRHASLSVWIQRTLIFPWLCKWSQIGMGLAGSRTGRAFLNSALPATRRSGLPAANGIEPRRGRLVPSKSADLDGDDLRDALMCAAATTDWQDRVLAIARR